MQEDLNKGIVRIQYGLERNHKNFTENLFQEKKQNYDYYRNEKEVVPGIAFGMKFFKECWLFLFRHMIKIPLKQHHNHTLSYL